MLNKYQVYDINNQIDTLKNNYFNKILAKDVNLKELSVGEYKYLIESNKNNIVPDRVPSAAASSDLNLKMSTLTETGVARDIKIAKLFNRTLKSFKGGLSQYNNKALTNRSYINLLSSNVLNLQPTPSANNNINVKYENFQFKRPTYNKFIYAMEKATKILILALKSSGCLISKPIFTIVYNGSGYGPSVKANDPRLDNSSISNTVSSLSEVEASLNTNNNLSNSSFNHAMPASGTAQEGANKKANFKVIIHLFYYIKKDRVPVARSQRSELEPKYSNILSILNDKLLYLSDYLTKLFNSNIEIELVRLYKPYQDSNILVQQLNSDSYNKKFIRIISRLFKTINIYKNKGSGLGPSGLSDYNDESRAEAGKGLQFTGNNLSFPSRISGLNIKLAGRTVKERVIPRLTVKRAQRGTLNRLNAKLIEKSMFTDKSRKGAFNFTVTLSHIFK